MILARLLIAALLWASLAACGTRDNSRVRSASSSEVAGFFAELHVRENQYRIEQGKGGFLSTGTSESDKWPAGAPTSSPRELATLPAAWRALQFNPPRPSASCSYVAIAGNANDATGIGAKAVEFGFTAPSTSWYYLLAECDLDGDPATNAFYFSSSTDVQISQQNPGR